MFASVALAVVLATSTVTTTPNTIYHGSSTATINGQPVIALTLDDCYSKVNGWAIRDILVQYNVHVTLFCVAQAMTYHPSLMRTLLADGNEFGDHSYTHPNLNKLTADQVYYQICTSRTVVDNVLGGPYSKAYLRPPYGRYNSTVLQVAGECGYEHLILWSIDTSDWNYTVVSADQIVSTVLNNAKNGSIVLMHISHANTVQALPRVIQGLRDRGFRLIKVSRMLTLMGQTP